MDFIIDNFDKLFDSEEHLKKLEGIILDLAVKGKLVPQNSNDEPASVLIEKIKAEKEKLIKEKKIKKDKELEPISDEEKPFEIPDSWEWVRLGEILTKLTDGAHSTPKYTESGIPFISVKDLSSGFIDFSNTKFISQDEHNELYKRCNPEYGDLLLTKIGTTGIAKIVDTEKEFSLFVSVALLKYTKEYIYAYYLENIINSPLVKRQAEENTRGVGNKNWVLKDIANTTIPLPPLAEQKRIVEKVDSLKKLIDTLKEKAKVRDKTREELKKSIMAEIEKSDSNIDLLNSLEMVFKNFDTIVKNKEDIKDIRDLILSMAVKGKLVPQNSDDEPASVLFEKIKAEKEKLIKEKKIKKDKELEPISDEEKPFEIPKSWEWVRLGEIILEIKGGGTPSKSNLNYWNGEIPWASVKDLKSDKYLSSTIDTITLEGLNNSSSNLIPKGNIIISTRMGLGKIMFNAIDVSINQDLKALIISKNIDSDFFYNYYSSLKIIGTGMTVKGIRQEELINFNFPLPPFAEQKRIVEKVDKLMALCDDLEKKVEKSQKEFEKILESAVQGLLKG